MNPYQLAIGQTVAFLGEALRGRHRILEVGCGRGEVARRLGATGHRITAIDLELHDRAPSTNVEYVQGDFLRYEAEPFDAVVFTASLHHITPLDAAIDRAYRLVVPRGLIIVDDFDLNAPNAAVLRWYYDTQELLVAGGLFPRECVDPPVGLPAGDVVQRWRLAHHHEPALHTGFDMRRAVAERFDVRDVHGAAFLYRYILKHLPHDERGIAIAQHLYNTERRGLADSTFGAVGLGIIAVRA